MVRVSQLLIIVRFECKEGDGDINDIRLGQFDGDDDDDDDTPGV